MSKSSSKVGLVFFVRPQFDVNLAKDFFHNAQSALERAGIATEVFEQPIAVGAEALSLAESINNRPDLHALIIVQGTFCDASLILNLAGNVKLPLLIWATKEEPTGERLRLNSFCGLNLGAHALVNAGIKFKGVYGSPDSPSTVKKVAAFARAAGAIKWLRGKRIGLFGHRPSGYYPSNFNEILLLQQFGISVEYVSLNEVFSLALEIQIEDIQHAIAGLGGTENLEMNATRKSVQAYLALKEIVSRKALDAVAVECWPEFMANFGGAVCYALSRLNDEGIVAACEADVNAAVTMLIGSYMSSQANFIADLVGAEEEQNQLIFWHCGNGPRSLIAPDTIPLAGVHPNRKIPLALYFPLKGGQVTISRLSSDRNGDLRLLLGLGMGIETKLLYSGNSLPVQISGSVQQTLDTILYEGVEHHYIVTYGDFTCEFRELAELLNLRMINF
ncbi:L-fucose/L-arabinose isomerase family protein [Desulfosporosinus sp. PR]|uniref:L-fucose/L-arabinose isomerase family protein n=1 Tax=Candidatus Desulfosporosinus nitrosoreducens TaxID=3401928 RepID=UPI0027F4CD91|nr:L-fucose/L-arabinose isomerase family protein [Desulfosporosinus sp. PR]MDQ7095316.1 L-fucose/L-arabinose isomerase family protein [Desulfosporosinus sp. PR]